MRIRAVGGAAGMAWNLGLLSGRQPIARSRVLMGTGVQIQVLADDRDAAAATLSMVLGPRRGRELLEELPGCEGYLVQKDLEVVRTSGFEVV